MVPRIAFVDLDILLARSSRIHYVFYYDFQGYHACHSSLAGGGLLCHLERGPSYAGRAMFWLFFGVIAIEKEVTIPLLHLGFLMLPTGKLVLSCVRFGTDVDPKHASHR